MLNKLFNQKKTIYCFVGKSGSGKTTLAKILEKNNKIHLIKSHTTRKPRYEGEDEYIFSTLEDYEIQNKNNEIFEETTIYGNKYWTTKTSFFEADKMIFICDSVGAKHLKKTLTNFNIIIVYFDADEETRKLRLSSRNSTTQNIENRLEKDRNMVDVMPADYVVVNNGSIEPIIKFLNTIIQ